MRRAVHDDTADVATLAWVLAVDLATGGQRWATTHREPDFPVETSDAP